MTGAQRPKDAAPARAYPGYYKWASGLLRYNADGTTTWVTQWPDPDHPETEGKGLADFPPPF